ncbi:MAG: benzoyl-CoA reductase, bzd-type, subunit Q, partial [Candidatus Helarchaeota archaeon]|nr:benzoyl-CoA reductase, bzd-type, subunit Q [Candidatus Helarchaeota archaeon]
EKVGLEKDIAVSGGVAKNIGVVSNMERMLGTQFKKFSVDPQIIGALGAAFVAKKAYNKKKE